MNGSTLLAHDLARGVRPIAGVDEVGSPAAPGRSLQRALFDLQRLAGNVPAAPVTTN
jgi:hypothetical protein